MHQGDTQLGMPVINRSGHDIVVIKPAGLPTEASRDPRRDTVLTRVANAHSESTQAGGPWLVHRLDVGTRGIVLVALTKDSAAYYNAQIRDKAWDKWYLARLPGPVPLGKHKAYLKSTQRRAEVVRSGGQPSFLEVLAVEPALARRNEFHALIRLLTGRFHQIRAMMANLGLPLVGDALYGGRPGPMYLEHAALRYVPFGASAPTVAHLTADPGREPIAPPLLEALRSATSAP